MKADTEKNDTCMCHREASLGVSACSKTMKCIYILDQNEISKYIFLFLCNSLLRIFEMNSL